MREERMQICEKRISHRNYLAKAIAPEKRAEVEKAVQAVNEASGLNFVLIWDDEEPFVQMPEYFGPDIGKNIRHFVIMTGPKDVENRVEKIAYYGVKLLLRLVELGFGTWFDGSAFEAMACKDYVDDIDDILGLLVFGPVADKMGFEEDQLRRDIIHRIGDNYAVIEAGDDAPDWFNAGAKAVRLMPRAISGGTVTVSYQDGKACASIAENTDMTRANLGVAKACFDYVVDGGTWEWGSGGCYQ